MIDLINAIKSISLRQIPVAGAGLLMLTACNGIFDDIYDQPDNSVVSIRGQLQIDATSWSDWYYVDLTELQALAEAADDDALAKAQTEFTPYPIPMEAVGDESTDANHAEIPGQYLYWFDVFGEGISKNQFTSFTPTAEQTAPDSWTFAVHRNNVRTNGCAALETDYTSFADLPETSEDFRKMDFAEDVWTENEVWDSQEQMLLCYVPSQGIRINKVLSSWLTLEIPPMPPAFTHNNHIFILRLPDGTYAALQLENYLSATGTKCWLTINYKYPY